MADIYFSEWVWRENKGNVEDEERLREGMKDSSGPREGVVALSTPEGVAVRNVPL